MTEERATLTFNEKQYFVDELSDKAKHIIAQIQDIDEQSRKERARLEQIEVARSGFTELLRQELEE